MQYQHHQIQALRLPEVMQKTGISRAQIYRMAKLGTFPRPHHLTETGRISAWDAAEVDTWLASKFEGGV
ncbi:MAG: AlpA family transcriptional regulator [Chloroflexi bacterium]|nr:AlpA family transcriptional regulator [Chloroflexota bacterium]